ncbi:phage baseplate plug family protein [Bacillus thuringiensis]|uniref:phage baseplate plug family protein n=1 Tax=Bacillus thuringiensis TaxID=1428 RepID=UPI003F6BB882
MHIEIAKEEIPYRFEMELANELFTFEVHYNKRFDFFTIGIEKDGQVIVAGEKVVLDLPLFYALNDKRLPKVTITPKDNSGREKRVTFENLGKTVLLEIGGLL